MHNPNVSVKNIFVSLGIPIKLSINQLDDIVLIGRPQTTILNPDGIKIAASDHKIVAFSAYDKLRIDLDRPPLTRPSRNRQKVDHIVILLSESAQ
jgi:hypothetical protein